MLHLEVSTMKMRPRCRATGPCASAALAGATILVACCLERPVLALGAALIQENAKPAENQKDAASRSGDAERKLLAALEEAIATHADHLDFLRLDRELAAAFRKYGLDLDSADPKAAGAKLAGHPVTPEIAAAIDEWCRVRRTRLKVGTWRRLVEVARRSRSRPLAQRRSRPVRSINSRLAGQAERARR